MAWIDPVNRNTGDLITAAIWNQDVVANGQFLHDRLGVLWVDGAGSNNGDFAAMLISGGGAVGRFSFRIPDDYESLVEATLIFIPGFTGTVNLALDTDYGNSGANEPSTQHSETATGLTQSVTNGKLHEQSLSSVLVSLAAGDSVGLKVTNNTASGNPIYAVGVYVAYNRV